MSKKINVAIFGVGNCAASFIEGVSLYSNSNLTTDTTGLANKAIGGYEVKDICIAMAVDVDHRKIGRPISSAMYSLPNCTKYSPIRMISNNTIYPNNQPPIVFDGPVLDGVAPHMVASNSSDEERFFLGDNELEEILQEQEEELEGYESFLLDQLLSCRIDVALLYLPVGSQRAVEWYVNLFLKAKVNFVNCIPVFIVSDPVWQQKIIDAEIVAIGDDMRSQFGASILSQILQETLLQRGINVKFHSQINQGGNTDFFNMTDKDRLSSKKISKENVIKSQNDIYGHRMPDSAVYAGPSDYIPYLKDNKVAHIRIEGEGFLGHEITLDCRLSVQDSPNSAGIVIDAVRYLMTAKDMGVVGPLYGPSAITQKTPPKQLPFAEAMEECKRYIEYKG